MASRSPRGRDHTRAAGNGGQQARLGRYYEQLREAGVLGTDLNSCGRRPSLGCPSPRAEEALSLEPKTVLRRSKYSFCDADMWCAMINGYVESGDFWKMGGGDATNRWQEGKTQNKTLKAARICEEEAHAELHKSIAQAYEEARGVANMCSRQLDLLHSQQDDTEGAQLGQHAGEGDDLDLCPPWANGPHVEAAEEAARRTDELSREMSLHQRELDKRGRLVEEMQRLERELGRTKCQTKECEKQDKQALALANGFSKTREGHLELGFPDVTFHDTHQHDGSSRSTVILSGAAGAHIDEALRTLTVEFATDGHLARATPNPALGLDRETAEAAKLHDLPFLLTMVWRRVCDGQHHKLFHGGA